MHGSRRRLRSARLLELALYEPFALAFTMVTFHRETEGREPDPEWKARIEGVSDKFRELTERAHAFARGTTPRRSSATVVEATKTG